MVFSLKSPIKILASGLASLIMFFSLSIPALAYTSGVNAVPVLNGVQGYNPENDTYSNGSATLGQYLILYGSFATGGNTVTVGGKQVAPDYQSDTQINVPITTDLGITPGSLDVKVSNSFGTSSPVNFLFVPANGSATPSGTPPNTTPPANTPPGNTTPSNTTPVNNAVPSSGLVCQDVGLEDQDGVCLPNNSFAKGEGISGSRRIGDVLTKVITILLTLAGVIAVLFIIIGGFQYMTARGNEEQATKGRKTFISALIGLIAILLAYTIVNIIYQTVTKGSIFS